MKVGGKGKLGAGDAVQLQNEAARRQQENSARRTDDATGQERAAQVNVALGKLIQQEFDPATMQAERKARVEELKALVQSGEYNPSSEDVARALGRDLIMEILASGE